MSSTSVTVRDDQNRSAIAAVRGHIRESIVSGTTFSPHMQASPPSIRAACSLRELRLKDLIPADHLLAVLSQYP
jgi:hypothetical protein